MRTAHGSETDGSGYRLRRALPEEVREIYGWRYDGPYAFYDMSRNPGDLDQMPDPDGREKFYSVLGPESGLAGFFSFIDEGDGELTVGLGMRPDLTGRGLGERFVRRGLEFGRGVLGANRFSLSVATFNERAIKVYERSGFRAEETFVQVSGSEETEFLRMSLHGPPPPSATATRQRD